MTRFSIFVLTIITVALASDVKRLQNDLIRAQNADRCQSKLQAKIDDVTLRVAAARRCVHNDLPTPEFERLRTLCAQRSSANGELRGCQKDGKDCSSVQARLDDVVAACTAVSRSASLNCAKIAPLSKQLAVLKRKNCGGGDIEAITKQFHEAVEKEAERMGLPASPYQLRILEPLEGRAEAVVFVLHGIFSSIEAVVPDAEELRKRIPKTRFILPQANVMSVTFFNRTGPSWFNILSNELDGPEDIAGVVQAATNINAIADVQRKVLGIAEDKVALYGISQGAALSITVYLRHVVSAAVSVAGFLTAIPTYPAALNPGSQGAPLLMFHGTADELVPYRFGELTRDFIRGWGRQVEFVTYGEEPHNLRARDFEMHEKAGQLFKKVLGFI